MSSELGNARQLSGLQSVQALKKTTRKDDQQERENDRQKQQKAVRKSTE